MNNNWVAECNKCGYAWISVQNAEGDQRGQIDEDCPVCGPEGVGIITGTND